MLPKRAFLERGGFKQCETPPPPPPGLLLHARLGEDEGPPHSHALVLKFLLDSSQNECLPLFHISGSVFTTGSYLLRLEVLFISRKKSGVCACHVGTPRCFGEVVGYLSDCTKML